MFRAHGTKALSLLVMLMLMLTVVPVTFAAEVTIYVNQDAKLGTILTDGSGNTLYRFTRDPINGGSVCYNACAVAWPPLLVDEGKVPVASEGVNGNLLGVITRTDGGRQVTFNGMPLYYFQNDTAAYQTNGQRRGNVWFVVHPNTTTIGGQGVALRQADSSLGPILTDGAGNTLYLFTKDSENLSVCYDGCATAWPPLLVSNASNVALDGIGGKIATTLRDDGNNQVTYNGKPLYYWFRDKKPGDTTGQNVGKVWFVIAPEAAGAAAPAAAPATTPASLPKTGEGSTAPLGTLALLALLIVGFGALVRSLRSVGRA